MAEDSKNRGGRPPKDVAVRRDYPVIHARVEPELKALFDALASRSGLSYRELIRLLTDEHVERLDAKERRAVEQLAKKLRAALEAKQPGSVRSGSRSPTSPPRD